MDKPVTYADLDRTLKAFGFEARESPGEFRIYRHAGRGALVSLPDEPLDKQAPFFSWGSVRATLADWGFIDRDDFFNVVHNPSKVAS